MPSHVPRSVEKVLWRHQQEALGVVRRYLASWGRGSRQSSLVQMPTGTGKTAVIVVAAHYLAPSGIVLVVAPRIALRDQLHGELSGGVFDKLGLAKPLERHARLVDESAQASEIGPNDIVVTTVQLLASATEDPAWARLFPKVSMVIFDEGHYEPAPTWSHTVRSVPCPRLIVSATPFRDDLKLFDVDPKCIYRYSHREAVAEGRIRTVQFVQRPPVPRISEFVQDVLAQYDRHFGPPDGTTDAPRAIIRCETPEEIRQVASALDAAGRTYVAIHHTFDTNAGALRRHVPDVRATTAIFWVHQNKLLEGIDDHRFKMLAVHRGLQAVRPFIQQAGRILRNPGGRLGETAVVLDYSSGRSEELWKNYLRYDEQVDANQAVEVNGEELVRALKIAMPGILYADGRFRSAVELDSISVADLTLPYSARILKKPRSYSQARAREMIAAAHARSDLLCRELVTDGPLQVVVHVRIGASSLLRDGYFAEPVLGATVLYEGKGHLFLYESGGSAVGTLLDAPPPQRSHLQKLFSTGPESRLTAVSLLNSEMGAEQVRSRSIAAANIGSLAPAFDEHGYLLSTATGYSDRARQTLDSSLVRRYVGAATGRVTDYEAERGSLEDWRKWVEAVEVRLQSSAKPAGVFRRWAADAAPPPIDECSAVNILIDVEDIRGRFETIGDSDLPAGQELEVTDACARVIGDRFTIGANGLAHDARVVFDENRARYRIHCPSLDAGYECKDDSETGVVAFLNRNQSFRIIPEAPSYLYASGSFCRPRIQFGQDSAAPKAALLGTLVPSAAMAAAHSEKGTTCKTDGAGWDDACLFGLIDKGFIGTSLEPWFRDVDVLVCDDLGYESADFVMVNRPYRDDRRRVVFIHAKASPNTHQCSASSLHVVCAQAQKNLREVSLFNDDVGNKARKWSGPWSARDVTGAVKTRVRPLGAVSSAADAWKHIRQTVRDASAEREVWLLIGNQLSRAAVEAQWSKVKPDSEAVQLAYLLLSTISITAAAGARLRVFCSP